MREARFADIGSGRTARVLKRSGADAGRSLVRRAIVGVERLEVVFREGTRLPLQSGVPMVLDRVIGAAGEKPSDGGPLVPELGVGADDRLVLVRSERAVLHLRRQLVTPPEAARFAGPARDRLADQRPVPRAVLLHETLQKLVLFRTPRAFDPVQIRSRRSH